jgi:hypothetical protein
MRWGHTFSVDMLVKTERKTAEKLQTVLSIADKDKSQRPIKGRSPSMSEILIYNNPCMVCKPHPIHLATQEKTQSLK